MPLADGYYWVRLGELGESSKRLPWEIVELSDGHWQREQCDLRSVVDVGDRLEAQQLAPPSIPPRVGTVPTPTPSGVREEDRRPGDVGSTSRSLSSVD